MFEIGLSAARLVRANGRVRYEAEAAFLISGMVFWALAIGPKRYPPQGFEAAASFASCWALAKLFVAPAGAALQSGDLAINVRYEDTRPCIAIANASITLATIAIVCAAAAIWWISARNFLVPVMADPARYLRIWTNLYFRTMGYLDGDIIGGPVGPILGPGILDVELDPAPTKKRFAHNEYWKWPARKADGVASRGQGRRAYDKPPMHLIALRQAINLFDSDHEEIALLRMRAGR